MNDLTPYLAFGGLLFTIIKFYGFIEDKEYKSARKQAVAWLGGVVVTLLAAQTSFAADIPTLGDATLGAATFADQVFIGLTVAGVAGSAFGLARGFKESGSTVVVNQAAPAVKKSSAKTI